MIEKVLVVEDFDVINQGIISSLKQSKIDEIDYVAYCDEAYLKIKKAYQDDNPFDLIISDLSFEENGVTQNLKSGDELIEKLRKEFPDLKILVFSVEDRPFRIQNLYKNLNINGYVWKSRNGLKELKKAIHIISNTDDFFISPELKNTIHPKKSIEITDYDIFLINNLSKGFLQEAISEKLKEKNIRPSSISAIEKRLKFLKEHFNASNSPHLVAITKDLGLI